MPRSRTQFGKKLVEHQSVATCSPTCTRASTPRGC
jgi:hypothetical protein